MPSRDDDLGVEQHARPALALLAPIEVHHDQALGDTDLRRGEADARLVVHGLGHVGGELAQRVVDLVLRDRRGLLAQARIGELEDCEEHGPHFIAFAAGWHPAAPTRRRSPARAPGARARARRAARPRALPSSSSCQRNSSRIRVSGAGAGPSTLDARAVGSSSETVFARPASVTAACSTARRALPGEGERAPARGTAASRAGGAARSPRGRSAGSRGSCASAIA